MEYRTNSKPEQSSVTSSVYLRLQRAKIVWDGPRYLIYNTKTDRLRTYEDWPRGMNTSHDELSEAGFLYTGIAFDYYLFSNRNTITRSD